MDDVGEIHGQPGDGLGEMDTKKLQEMSMPMAMISRPSVSIDVRRWNKEGFLRDEAVAFGLSCQSGDKVLVFANRQAARLTHLSSGKEVSQDILLAWTDDRPWFICACEREVTKLHLYGSRFICRRCLEGPAQRRRKRVPARQRQRVLARDGFRCVGCGTAVGGLVVKRACNRYCLDFDCDFDEHVYTCCGLCHDMSRQGLAGISALTDRHLALEWLGEDAEYALLQSDATRGLKPFCPNITAGHHSGPEPDSNDATKATIVSRKRRENNRERRYRVYIMLLAGCKRSEIEVREKVSRWTVWRRRKELQKLEKLLTPLRQMMRKATRRKDWKEARFWWQCLTRVGADIDGEDKASGRGVRKWKQHLEALRDEALGRKETGDATKEEEATPTTL